MVDMNTGALRPGGTLLKDFDPFKVSEIAVRLKEPIYRGGFGKEEQILETYITLPPRLVRYDNNSMFTIQRGRTPARLILSQANAVTA